MATKPRSVIDYDSEDALRKALMISETTGDTTQIEDTAAVMNSEISDAPTSDDMDWVLRKYDAETTEVQSMKQELHRLQVLKSYLILDSEREEAFERLTGMAARIFNVPIALISLVDLGRQWFMSNRGLGDVRETPRRHAFCAHAILNKHNIMIVPDATRDFRFKDNPLVLGAPNIRFYAGAPLISPEGFKLGTFCIIDSRTRPEGLSQDDQMTLRDFADMAVKELVDRRYKLQTQESPAQLIAYTAHDLMTPLTGVQLSLSLLKEDEDVQSLLGVHHMELLTTAANCSDLMIRICQTAIDTLRHESTQVFPSELPQTSKRQPTTKMVELVKSLQMILEPIPKKVPLIITLDSSVPEIIMVDDLQLFRSSLNLLSSAFERTEFGSVHFKIFMADNSSLMFESTDTGKDIPIEEYRYLFQPNRLDGDKLKLGLSSIASLINSLDGQYGFRPRDVSDDDLVSSTRRSGSVFWFSIPVSLPESFGISNEENVTVIQKNSNNQSMKNRTGKVRHPFISDIPSVAVTTEKEAALISDSLSKANKTLNAKSRCPAAAQTFPRTGSSSSVLSAGKKKLSIFVDSAVQAEAVHNSCFRDCFETNILGADTNDRKVPAVSNLSQDDNSSTRRQSIGVANTIPSVAASAGREKIKCPRIRRALVIDDSLVVRKGISMALEKLGFDVWQAGNGMEGLQAMKANTFDLVLCDFLMPVMDGMDCAKQYRAWEKRNRPRFHQLIVGISAHATVNDGGQGIIAGMDMYQPKPITLKYLTSLQDNDVVISHNTILDKMEGYSNGSSASNLVDEDTEFKASIDTPHEYNKLIPPSVVAPAVASFKRFEADDISISSDESPTRKRTKIDDRHLKSAGNEETPVPVALIATDTPTIQSNDVLTRLEAHGWKVVVVHDGKDAFRLLKMRNWDVVLIDDCLPIISGAKCISKFRLWEEQNRVNKQRNVIMACDVDIPSPFDKSSYVQPPSGFDGVIHKPISWNELEALLRKSSKNCHHTYELVVRH